MRYPDATRLDLVELLHGHRVADPYRWLEDERSTQTTQWSELQDELARSHLDDLPGRERLHATLTALLGAGSVGPPAWRQERAFSTRREAGQEHAVLQEMFMLFDGGHHA